MPLYLSEEDQAHREWLLNLRNDAQAIDDRVTDGESTAAEALRLLTVSLQNQDQALDGELAPQDAEDLRAHLATAVRELRAAGRIVENWGAEVQDQLGEYAAAVMPALSRQAVDGIDGFARQMATAGHLGWAEIDPDTPRSLIEELTAAGLAVEQNDPKKPGRTYLVFTESGVAYVQRRAAVAHA